MVHLNIAHWTAMFQQSKIIVTSLKGLITIACLSVDYRKPDTSECLIWVSHSLVKPYIGISLDAEKAATIRPLPNAGEPDIA